MVTQPNTDYWVPSQLHFARPAVYDEIYNSHNKWDKDYGFYRAFDMDESLLSQTGYLEAKHRRALIANMFSRRAISDVQHLVREQARFKFRVTLPQSPNGLCSWIDSVMRSRSRMQLVGVFHTIPLLLTGPRQGKSSDLYFGFQCLSADIVTSFLFATCFNQISFPDFQGDIVKGIDLCLPTVTMAKHSLLFLWIVRYFPPSILMLLAPSLKGLVVFRKVSLDGVITLRLSHKTTTLDAGRPSQECHAKPKVVERSITPCLVRRAPGFRGKQGAPSSFGITPLP